MTDLSRRDLLNGIGRAAGLAAIGGVLGFLLNDQHAHAHGTRWQIDPTLCTQCGRCATDCVLNPSAARCFHAFALCGYCDLCTGFFDPGAPSLDTGAENQLCPTAAIKRKFIEDPYFEYDIDRNACIGCARCVKGCVAYGNGSLHLQIDQSLCKRCNQCAIAKVCPSNAIKRVDPPNVYIAPRVKGT